MTIEIGVVGSGFVGGAVIKAFSNTNPIHVYDLGKGIGSLEDVVSKSEIIFLCLPSPQAKDGGCDGSIVAKVIWEIAQLASNKELVVKSTLPPKFFESVQRLHMNNDILYMPEFLTARCADLDFINSSRFIIGAGQKMRARAIVEAAGGFKTYKLFRSRFPGAPIKIMSWEEASLVKYVTNCFFVTKVAFFNEVYDVCNKLEIDYEVVVGEVLNDGRIARSHYQVPGPDGQRGFGGACFPKDSSAFVQIAESLAAGADVVKAARKVNDRVRPSGEAPTAE